MKNTLILYTLIIFLAFPAISLSQNKDTILKDKPRHGEGIYSFLKRHNLSYSEYGSSFIQLNKGKFGKNNSLLIHHEYELPVDRSIDINPLFGEKYKTTKITSKELKGAVIYLVNGHGGPDPGASGKYGTHTMYEDEYAYDIVLRLGKSLISKGATVHMIIEDKNDGIRDNSFLTYDNDETCNGKTIPLDQLERLKQRTNEINKLYKKEKSSYKRCIIIHLDSRSKRKQIDVFFYHTKGSKRGKEMATTLQQTFSDKYNKHQPQRGFSGTVSSRNLYILRKTNPVAVFIELGNIQNYRDQQRFIDENNRQALANWLTEGVIIDFNNQKRK